MLWEWRLTYKMVRLLVCGPWCPINLPLSSLWWWQKGMSPSPTPSISFTCLSACYPCPWAKITDALPLIYDTSCATTFHPMNEPGEEGKKLAAESLTDPFFVSRSSLIFCLWVLWHSWFIGEVLSDLWRTNHYVVWCVSPCIHLCTEMFQLIFIFNRY